MISIDEAQRILGEAARPLDVVEASLDACHRLVLGEEVTADRDFPPTDRSAMDGFAVRSADIPDRDEDTVLEIAGEVRTGESADGLEVGVGQAARIFTGAVIPSGADAVVMVERTEEDRAAGTVRIRASVSSGQHVRPRGSEFHLGDPVLRAGSPIHAAEIAALASVGHTRVRVHRPPRVNVLSTGDEVIEPDRTPAPHQIRNSNGGTLLAQLRELGLRGLFLGNASDTAGELAEKLALGVNGDVLLVTGGVSVGEYDLVGRALSDAGMDLLFHKVAVKPGKPMLAGRCGGCLVVGLPGNPVSAFTGFAVFVAPVLRKMMGYRRWETEEMRATLDGPLKVKPGRKTYHLARLSWREGQLRGERIGSTGSGDVLSLARANGFLVTSEEGADLGPGDQLTALPWNDAHHR
jgi:molybdopterin molybdotransferase